MEDTANILRCELARTGNYGYFYGAYPENESGSGFIFYAKKRDKPQVERRRRDEWKRRAL